MSFPTKEEFTLPANFDGVFRLSNPSATDFIGVWNKVQYKFPAGKTTPVIIPNETLENVQHITKKFARELAEREFHNSERFKKMESITPPGSGLVPAPYSEMELKEYADKCLLPLEEVRPTMAPLPPENTANYHTDVTQVVDHKDNENKKPLVEGKDMVG